MRHFLTLVLLLLILFGCQSRQASKESFPKRQFCSQAYFDSVFFDGQLFKFVIVKEAHPMKAVVDMFTIHYDHNQNVIFNYTHNTSTDPFIHQGGIHLPLVSLYLEFYYRDPIGYSSVTQVDYNAYEYWYRQSPYNMTPQSMERVSSLKHSKQSSARLSRLFHPKIITDYTAKNRLYLYEPKSKLVWIVLSQNPTYYGWIEMNSAKTDYNQKWTFEHEKQNLSDSIREHFYTGAFILNGSVYLVEEQISQYGFRYPNIVREVDDLKKLTFKDFKMPLNEFFNCHPIEGLNAFQKNPDEGVGSFTTSMIIFTVIMVGFLVLSILLAFMLYHDSNEVLRKLLKENAKNPSGKR